MHSSKNMTSNFCLMMICLCAVFDHPCARDIYPSGPFFSLNFTDSACTQVVANTTAIRTALVDHHWEPGPCDRKVFPLALKAYNIELDRTSMYAWIYYPTYVLHRPIDRKACEAYNTSYKDWAWDLLEYCNFSVGSCVNAGYTRLTDRSLGYYCKGGDADTTIYENPNYNKGLS